MCSNDVLNGKVGIQIRFNDILKSERINPNALRIFDDVLNGECVNPIQIRSDDILNGECM